MLAYQSIGLKKEEKSESTVEKEVATTTTNPLAEKKPPQMSAYLVETIIKNSRTRETSTPHTEPLMCMMLDTSTLF